MKIDVLHTITDIKYLNSVATESTDLKSAWIYASKAKLRKNLA